VENGQGVTCESSKSCGDNGLIWRLSLAEISQDGPFSNFSNLSRTLIFTISEGMRLVDTDTNTKMLVPFYKPILFSGGQSIEAQLISGQIQKFNVIYDSTKIKSSVYILEGPGGKKLSPRNS
jgi:environmental stress-induced protein Ves